MSDKGNMPRRPALRYHGGKFRIAEWIVQHFPPHLCYVESFGGAAGVMLKKERSYSEVYNDLDSEIVNFFRVLRDPETRKQLINAVKHTPYARDEFERAWEQTEEPVERARRTAIRAQMGFGSAGAVKGSTGFRIDTRRKYGTAQHLWLEYPGAISLAGERFEGVLIENRPAIDVIQQHDAPDTLHFVDPPYVHSTRVFRPSGGYRHEMTDDEHHQLLDVLQAVDGMVVLSGYKSDLYLDLLKDWEMRTTAARAASNKGGTTRQEVIWMNQACASALQGFTGGLFVER